MDFEEVLKRRRSVRKFQDRQIRQETYKWARTDLGAFEMMLLLCAANKGIHSVVAQTFVKYPDIVRKHLYIPENEGIIIGIGLGYAEEADRMNSFRSSRKALSTIVTIKE